MGYRRGASKRRVDENELQGRVRMSADPGQENVLKEGRGDVGIPNESDRVASIRLAATVVDEQDSRSSKEFELPGCRLHTVSVSPRKEVVHVGLLKCKRKCINDAVASVCNARVGEVGDAIETKERLDKAYVVGMRRKDC